MHRLEGAAAVEGFQHAGEDESGQPHREGHRRLAEGAQLVTEVQHKRVHEAEKEDGLPHIAAHGALAQRREGPQHRGQRCAGRKSLLYWLQHQRESGQDTGASEDAEERVGIIGRIRPALLDDPKRAQRPQGTDNHGNDHRDGDPAQEGGAVRGDVGKHALARPHKAHQHDGQVHQ